MVRALARPDLTKERWNASDGGKFRGDGLGFGDVRKGTERYGLRDRLEVDDDGDEDGYCEDGYCGHDHRNGGRDDHEEEEEDQQL
ncbi:unnamed protein product [Sphagnum balticum]